ncbi:MAG: DNA-binding protein [Rhodobacteraceae bacterium]|nr:DNA-binding protein [Paracoccaceae bacterium]
MSGGDDRVPHFSQAELADRWRITTRTLERWRAAGIGPAWMRLNGLIRYRAADVCSFEQARLHRPKR